MFKKLLLITLLIALCFSIEKTQQAVGGYQTVQGNDLKQLLTDATFLKVQQAARTYYSSTNGGAKLGKISKVETQVVEGINYKITFKTKNGPVQVVVWAEPWEQSYQVTGVYKNLKTEDNSQNDSKKN